MRSIQALFIFAGMATLADSRADFDFFSDEDYSVDPLLFSFDDLSESYFLADDNIFGENIIGDDLAFTASLANNDDTVSLFTDIFDECSLDGGGFGPSRKIRARENPSCPVESSSNSPAVRFPNLDDLETNANPVTWHGPETQNLAGFGPRITNKCVRGVQPFPQYAVCGNRVKTRGMDIDEYSLFDAEICKG